ncbi:MAG: leucine-rich repeat domain-containing protein [Eubacterium sp.]|nr:leucine-rich repeat domain-containing protein [Eubacterium sp.]
MKFTKKLSSVLLAIVMLFSITAGMELSAYAATSGTYEYDVLADGTVEITEYFGYASTEVVPDTIDGKTVTSIGEGAFFMSGRLVEVTLPNSIVNIGESAFTGCEKLTTVTIGSGTVNIADDAFLGCEKLASINIDSNNANYASENGVLYNKSKTTLIQYPCGKAETSFAIPNCVTSIGEAAFMYSLNLKTVTIPNSVTSIGDGAFAMCGLTSATIPSGVVSLGDAAFFMCENLKSVSIGANVTDLGEGVFAACSSLTAITVDANNKKYSASSGVLYNKEKTELL